jgi:ribosome-binding protein aMBF1 (putative translation factor)
MPFNQGDLSSSNQAKSEGNSGTRWTMSWRQLRSPEHEELRRLIKERRQRAGLTQKEVADKLGRPQRYISQVETGSHRVTVMELLELGEAIGFDPRAAVARLMRKR